MNILLCADLHLTDNPLEEYRWLFIEKQLPQLVVEHAIKRVYILGDFTDRKDRHSAALINRLVTILDNLQARDVLLFILMGNHDGPVSGQPYWEFLDAIGVRVEYITVPYRDPELGVICLPFASNPLEEWKTLNLGMFKAIFMHQTVGGAEIEGGRRIQGNPQPMPILPRGVPVYSGDVHCPQQIGTITYVGCPYPTRFGENWGGRVLIINTDNFKSFKEVKLPCIQRRILDLDKANPSLSNSELKEGDQIRVRYHLSTADLAYWPEYESNIKEEAQYLGVQLLSIEAVLSEVVSSGGKEVPNNAALEMLGPAETLRLFSEEEKIPSDLVDVGLELLRTAQQ